MLDKGSTPYPKRHESLKSFHVDSRRTNKATLSGRQKSKSTHHLKNRNITSSERVKYFRTLGIESPSIIKESLKSATARNKSNSRRSILGNVNVYTEPLKYDCEQQEVATTSLFQSLLLNNRITNESDEDRSDVQTTRISNSSSLVSVSSLLSLSDVSDGSVISNKCNKTKPRITFNDTVSVLPIPRRDEYSDRIKSLMWSDANELNINAYRNTIEFASENWDWEAVVEDDGMYICQITGEKIHPIHMVEQEYTEDFDHQEEKQL